MNNFIIYLLIFNFQKKIWVVNSLNRCSRIKINTWRWVLWCRILLDQARCLHLPQSPRSPWQPLPPSLNPKICSIHSNLSSINTMRRSIKWTRNNSLKTKESSSRANTSQMIWSRAFLMGSWVSRVMHSGCYTKNATASPKWSSHTLKVTMARTMYRSWRMRIWREVGTPKATNSSKTTKEAWRCHGKKNKSDQWHDHLHTRMLAFQIMSLQ